MSSPIDQRTQDSAGDDPLGSLAFAGSGYDPLGPVDAHRGAPVAEVLAQMSTAERLHDDLLEAGLRVRFDCPADGPLAVGLYGSGEQLIRSLSPAEAVELAFGRWGL